MNCLIVDDNPIARKVLRHYMEDLNFLTIAGDCENTVEASNILNEQQVDLMLLDVEMPRMSGLDFLKTIPDHPLVILITANPVHAVSAFEYNVVDFLLKPLKEDRFIKAIYRAKEIFDSKTKVLDSDKDYFFIREKGVSTKLMISDILYIQALGDYVTIHTESKKIHHPLFHQHHRKKIARR